MRRYLRALIPAYLMMLIFTSQPAIAQSASRAYTPRPGSTERRAILDAVRDNLGIKNQFEVVHMRVNQRWAFFRGNALVFEGGEKVEVDSVMALLRQAEKGGKATWQVEHIWSLGRDSDQPMEHYLEAFRKRQRDDRIPADIFPEEIIKPEARSKSR